MGGSKGRHARRVARTTGRTGSNGYGISTGGPVAARRRGDALENLCYSIAVKGKHSMLHRRVAPPDRPTTGVGRAGARCERAPAGVSGSGAWGIFSGSGGGGTALADGLSRCHGVTARMLRCTLRDMAISSARVGAGVAPSPGSTPRQKSPQTDKLHNLTKQISMSGIVFSGNILYWDSVETRVA